MTTRHADLLTTGFRAGLGKRARVFIRIVCLLLPLGLASCFDGPVEAVDDVGKTAPLTRAQAPFSDVTTAAGIDFVHFNAATPQRWLPETMGSGVAFFDFDNDGLPDLYFANGAPLGKEGGPPHYGKLYRNIGGGRFIDVTAGSGLEESFFGMGIAIGDLENDGLPDMVITGVDRTRVFRNLGGGKFENVTSKMGLDCTGFGSSAAFLDYDRDGFLDLYVGRYVVWSPDGDIPCSPDGVHRTYCTPEVYPGIANCLFRNLGGTRFKDVSRVSGIGKLLGKTLGVSVVDYNSDGWPDVVVANDTERNFLFVNQGDGTFLDSGVDSGMAYSESGAARGGMGIDTGDIDGDGQVDIVIGNFSQEMTAVFRSVESDYFVDDAAQVGVGIPTLMTLAFGTLVEDFNGDGWLDILIANGHIEPNIADTRHSQTYRQPLQFFRNAGQGKFEAVERPVEGAGDMLLVARGFASADFDLDGDLDFVVCQNGDRAYLLRNNSEVRHWLKLRFVGTKSNRMGFGVKVKVIAGETSFTRQLTSGRSYLSACDPTLVIGLGSLEKIDRLEIRWPSGIEQTVTSPETNRLLEIQEPSS